MSLTDRRPPAAGGLLAGCDLHLHVLGAYHAADVLDLGRDVFIDGAWDEYQYESRYESAFGVRPDPRAIFREALASPSREAGIEVIKRWHVFAEADGGSFVRWSAKFNFFMGIWTKYRHIGGAADVTLLQHMIDRYWAQGLDYVEYRCGSGFDGFLYFHSLCARMLQAASGPGRTARYILSLQRFAPLEAYAHVQRLFDEYPDLVPTIVGVDFANQEQGFPPKEMRPLFESIAAENRRAPDRALDVVYHVGEEFFDKSLESAIRWCHEVAEMGASRLGHAIALGLDPDVAIHRRPHGHERESVSERRDQIDYDLRHRAALRDYDVDIDREALLAERTSLEGMDAAEQVERRYSSGRLEEIRRRQEFVLQRLTQLGAVIECCPTSNLRIGGVPEARHHPVHRFLASKVDLVVCTDDPGNFDVTLEAEIEWVRRHTGLSAAALGQRLGDPRRFRLGQRRQRRAQPHS